MTIVYVLSFIGVIGADNAVFKDGLWTLTDGKLEYVYEQSSADTIVTLKEVKIKSMTDVPKDTPLEISGKVELGGVMRVVKNIEANIYTTHDYSYFDTPYSEIIVSDVDSVAKLNGKLITAVVLKRVGGVNPRAFWGNSKMRSLDTGGAWKLHYIPETAFAYTALESFDFAEIDSIGEQAFLYGKMKTIDLSRVKSIAERAFYGAALESVVMPDSLDYLGAGVFEKCNLGTLDVRRTVLDHTNADIVKNNPRFTTLTAPNLVFLPKGAFEGTAVTRLTDFPNLKVIEDPKPFGRYERVDVPSAEHIELRYAFVDTLVVGPNVRMRTASEVSEEGNGGPTEYYERCVFPGLELGQSWLGYIEVDSECKDFEFHDDGALCRSLENVGKETLALRYMPEIYMTGTLDLWHAPGEDNVPYYDITAGVLTRAIPEVKAPSYYASDDLPGGTVLCDYVDSIFIDVPLSYMFNYGEGSVRVENTQGYYRLRSFKLTKPRKSHPVRIYVHPSVERNFYDEEILLGWASGCPVRRSHKYGNYPDYRIILEDDYRDSFEFITRENDPDGVIDRWVSAGLAAIERGGGLTVWADGLELALGSMDVGAHWSVVSMTGRTVSTGVAASDGSATAQLPAPGIYIVRCGATTLKVAAR